MAVTIDYSRDGLLTEFARKLLCDFYLRDDETSPQEGYARAATAWSGGDDALAQRLYDYASRGWFMFSSPVLSNAPKPGEKAKGLPISCFLSYVPDNLKGLIDHTAELRWLSVLGGGVGGHWSDVRSVSDIAPGPIPFLHTVDADMTAYRQGKTRKGSYAAYMDISHPDIVEFLSIRVPTGDTNRKCLNLHHAVSVTDDFMRAVDEDGPWNLVDPNDGTVRETVRARDLWQQILEIRYRTGEPYVFFIDTANRALPETQKALGLKLRGSNLCIEIMQATGFDIFNRLRTAICCLSSPNLELYDEWKDTPLIADLVTMLDNIITYFIENAPPEIGNAIYAAMRERSIGIGGMGFHSYLQRHNVPFESEEARRINIAMFRDIQAKAIAQSLKLGAERGEAPDMAGTGRRNAMLIAVAPNANSAIIVGTSPSTEASKANAYTHRTRAGSWLVKNKYLEARLEDLGQNTDEVWSDIITSRGSVQHLDFLTDHDKAVFKTAIEIDQHWVVRHAGDRQPFICQGQSVNLFFPPRADKAYVNSVHLAAWKEGLKGLYYLRTETSNRAETVSKKIERVALQDANKADECTACHA